MSGALSGPEGSQTAQNVAAKLVKPYLMMAEQFQKARIPGYKMIAELFNKPTSQLQKLFTTNSISWNIREMSVNIRDLAADDGLIRNEKLPGEKKSQVQQLSADFRARPLNVIGSELLNMLMMYLFFVSAGIFPKILSNEKR